MSLPDISIPQARNIAVDTTGAQIVQEESPAVSRRASVLLVHRQIGAVGSRCYRHAPQQINQLTLQTRDSRGIYLPHYIEPVSHIAIDVSSAVAVDACVVCDRASW
jgi:type II pantothenate kinase